jgi:hypothetical protein
MSASPWHCRMGVLALAPLMSGGCLRSGRYVLSAASAGPRVRGWGRGGVGMQRGISRAGLEGGAPMERSPTAPAAARRRQKNHRPPPAAPAPTDDAGQLLLRAQHHQRNRAALAEAAHDDAARRHAARRLGRDERLDVAFWEGFGGGSAGGGQGGPPRGTRAGGCGRVGGRARVTGRGAAGAGMRGRARWHPSFVTPPHPATSPRQPHRAPLVAHPSPRPPLAAHPLAAPPLAAPPRRSPLAPHPSPVAPLAAPTLTACSRAGPRRPPAGRCPRGSLYQTIPAFLHCFWCGFCQK